MKRILLVEDDREYSNLLSKKLKDSGFLVHEATNGQEGLNKLHKSKFDLILLDLVMTKMDGLTFYEKFKKTLKKQIPVVILSNVIISNKDKLIKDREIEDYIIKANTTLGKLVERIQDITRH